ncbi:hypothetical protein SAMN02745181_0495 [Rubritalea squalenifaciens DSM 18772]|uniref:Uncharacterized protein n=1 Tax=Rubritalea squalenifaciens DSM 18772 TaxID=1123071 RepID=A0A1M6CJF1_9BACT|nr:hypothetical protein [Rubritalea squalenifaciens]SHI61126.1 hypothetical protein SAMN02745181_0495 [Rubritalea squalenifaciens DSM 18772]
MILPLTKRRWFRVTLILVIILVAAPFLAPTWSPVNCRHEEIDLDTGRVRYTRMLYWIPVRTEIYHTPISEALGVTDLKSRAGDWQRVNTFSPGVRYSPHYIYHSALSQTQTLAMMWELQQYSHDARKEAAATVLKLWKTSGRDSGADDYISRLASLPLDEVGLEDISHLDITKGEQAGAANKLPAPSRKRDDN